MEALRQSPVAVVAVGTLEPHGLEHLGGLLVDGCGRQHDHDVWMDGAAERSERQADADLEDVESVGSGGVGVRDPALAEAELHAEQMAVGFARHHQGDRRAVVHRAEVGWVGGVVEHQERVEPPGTELDLSVGMGIVVFRGGDVSAERVEHVGRGPRGGGAVTIMPEVDDVVALDHRPGAHPYRTVRPVLVRDADVVAVAIPLPAVKRTGDQFAADRATVSETPTHVRAVGVEGAQVPGLGAKDRHVLPEVLLRDDLADGKVGGPADLEPPCRLHHGLRPSAHGPIISHLG